jgi:ankyrin repeat protein
LLDRGADVGYSDNAALLFAARHGHLVTATLLLDRGADAWSELAMQWAVENEHGTLVALLLERRRT